MPKARSFTPSAAETQRWYSHRHEENRASKSRTSTREMQEAPFDPRNISRTATNMPRVFYTRMNYQTPVFKHQNAFTDHDNRNAFQGHGVYFGVSRDERTLGKRLRAEDLGSDGRRTQQPDYLKHDDGSRYGYDYRTTQTTAFAPIGEPTMPAIFRRFRRCHTHPDIPLAEPPTCTTEFAPLPPGCISTETLGQAQIPYAGSNQWKYSYNRLQRAYPDLPALRTAGVP